jgi:hypothetical protein
LICQGLTIGLRSVSFLNKLAKSDNKYILDEYDNSSNEELLKVFYVYDNNLLTNIKELDEILVKIYKKKLLLN